jgi:hypothetical protein
MTAPDRILVPIYDAIDALNYRLGLTLCNKALKKYTGASNLKVNLTCFNGDRWWELA